MKEDIVEWIGINWDKVKVETIPWTWSKIDTILLLCLYTKNSSYPN
jgi:hypothetical protein